MASFTGSFRPSWYMPRTKRCGDGFPDQRSPKASPILHEDENFHDTSEDYEEEEQFVLSVANTPVTENAPRLRKTRRATLASSQASLEHTQSFGDLAALAAGTASTCSDSAMGLQRSRPIAIELPVTRKISTDPAPNPQAPLSARGDLPGGYFPKHEDPETRVHRPHPFYADAKEARRKSIAKASKDSHSPRNGSGSSASNGSSGSQRAGSTKSAAPSLLPPATAPATAAAPGLSGSPRNAGLPSSAATTQVQHSNSLEVDHTAAPSIASYNPTGAEDNLLPMGKYYPTNWENRKRAKRMLREQQPEQEHQGEKKQGLKPERRDHQQQQRSPRISPRASPSLSATTSAGTSSKLKAENPSVTRAKAPPMMGHSRSDSEAKRRLQQYQRDMITQATLAASRVLGTQIQQRGPETVLQTLNRIPTLRNLQLSPPNGGTPSVSVTSAEPFGAGATASTNPGFGILSKPVSPRLQPLGSPGPVTPIDLAANTEEAGNGVLLPVGRPRMPIGVVTAPPAAGPRAPRPSNEPAFPFGADGP